MTSVVNCTTNLAANTIVYMVNCSYLNEFIEKQGYILAYLLSLVFGLFCGFILLLNLIILSLPLLILIFIIYLIILGIWKSIASCVKSRNNIKKEIIEEIKNGMHNDLLEKI
jgi:hypothetical protein